MDWIDLLEVRFHRFMHHWHYRRANGHWLRCQTLWTRVHLRRLKNDPDSSPF